MTERNTEQSTIKDIRSRTLNKAEIGRSLFIGGFVGGGEYLAGRLFGLWGTGQSIAMGVGAITGTHAYRVFSPEVPNVYKTVVEKILKRNNSPKLSS